MANRVVTKKLNTADTDFTSAYLEMEKISLREAQKDLERSRKELEQFMYMATHDLQEPLRMVASYTQLLAKRYRGMLDADADDFISYAADGATRMQRMLNNMLAYSRVRKTGARELIPTDCEYVLQSAMANLKLVIESSGAVITRDPMPVLMADDVQLVQVFQNLIGNAIKFCGDRKPEIHVGAELKNDECIFQVRDNGIGIAERDREQIFVMFKRLHNQQKYCGSGIGLAICKKIVEHHAGRIWVESEPGKGSTFYFSIPVGAEEYEYANHH